ncbi:MAG: 4Fe-4S binding protein [Candidatus Aminicenantes bacterium]|nr:4Fe-4S binding protein [Candidatus Aminicenantes bacterium]
MKRQIIRIDEDKCNGCGQCVPGCPEGALRIIDDKARLISDLFCDGLGACIGTCPQGAIIIEEREAEPYDERKVMINIIKQGPNTIRAHLIHLKEHNESAHLKTAVDFLKEQGIDVPDLTPAAAAHTGVPGGCPGAAMRDMRDIRSKKPQPGQPPGAMGLPVESQLRQWPVQLQLINPRAPYLQDADLLVAADCVPFAYANFHQRFLKDKVMVIFCPKLDQTIDQYIEKLTAIFLNNNIKSISVVQMEVPCCSGTLYLVQKALEQAKKIIPIKDYTISITGEII